MDGILLIDKPKGWTSFDVVAKIRGLIKQETGLKKPKVGHTGTLDPLATGLLIIVVGTYCKRAGEFSKLDKVYEVTMKLGQTSTTGDEEGKKTPYDMHQPACFTAEPQNHQASLASEHFSPAILGHRTICTASCVSRRENAQMHRVQAVGCRCHIPTKSTIAAVLSQFTGEQMQTPPIYSAIKVDGQRAYKLARAGKEVKLEPRKVTIYSISDVKYSYPEVRFTTKVSSGTYVRSLVEDIGKQLGVGAYMSALSRTEVGNFKLTEASTIEGITQASASPLKNSLLNR